MKPTTVAAVILLSLAATYAIGDFFGLLLANAIIADVAKGLLS